MGLKLAKILITQHVLQLTTYSTLQKRAGIINFVVKIYTSNLFYLTSNLLQVILHKTYIYEIFFVFNFFFIILKIIRIVRNNT